MFNLFKFILINCSMQVLRSLFHFGWRSQHTKASLQREPRLGFNFGIFFVLSFDFKLICYICAVVYMYLSGKYLPTNLVMSVIE